MAKQHLLQEGDHFGVYTIDRFLGAGAFAEVYRVKHPFLGQQAMKVFNEISMTFEDTCRLLDEAVILSRINHPNIVRVYDANVVETVMGPRGFFTMEYVAMGTLEQYRQTHINSIGKLLSVDEVVNIMRQACRGVAAAHGSTPPIIHRDIKPQNILVGFEVDGLRVRLSDFGLAKNLSGLALKATARGTLLFKPPEVFAGTYNDSLKGDVWALGTTLYLLLTDMLPYQLTELQDMRGGRQVHTFIPPHEINPNVEKGLEKIVERSLAIDINERYPTAKEMLADLEKWQPHAPTTERNLPQGYTTRTVIVPVSEVDPDEATRLSREALILSRDPSRLSEAADLMEEAFHRDPSIKKNYDYQVTLWRRGIMN